jgi:hypothetical protein
MKKSALFMTFAAAAVFIAGCANYRWGTSVPAEYRTVSVPVFENTTEVSELGPMVTQYALREFQREGTFKIARAGNAAVEVQGVITKFSRYGVAYDRSMGSRASEYSYTVSADVTFVDKRNGKILRECRGLQAETSFLVQDDLLTGQKNAAARIADDFAKQIVNEALAIRYPAAGAVEGVQK